MLKKLAKIANRLDSLGLTKEADVIDRYLIKKADTNFNAGSGGSASQGDTGSAKSNRDPGQILEVKSIEEVQSKLTSIQNALNNPSDIIFGINKDQIAIKAYSSLMLVLSQAITETPIAKQLSSVKEAVTDWNSWATLNGKVNMTSDNRKIYDFLKAAEERLSAGEPVFNFQKPNQTTTPRLQDDKWKRYLAGDKKRAAIWDAWVKSRESSISSTEDVDLSFDNYVLWWKSNKADRKFNDNNAGGISATIQRLKDETNPS